MPAKKKPTTPEPPAPPPPPPSRGAWRVERATIQPDGTLTDRQIIGEPAVTPGAARTILDAAYQAARDETPRPFFRLVWEPAEKEAKP